MGRTLLVKAVSYARSEVKKSRGGGVAWTEAMLVSSRRKMRSDGRKDESFKNFD